MNYPKYLLKYQKFKDYSRKMLETGYIYFCPANEFDDLFECAISIANEISFNVYQQEKNVESNNFKYDLILKAGE